MRPLTVPESGPKRKLIDAAERLFAERGFDNVSVRDVTGLAGTNVAAVNYHFGSSEQMMSLVIFRYGTPVNDERLARLETAERKWSGKGLPLEEIIDAYLRPLLVQSRRTDLSDGSFYQLLGRILAKVGDGMAESNAQPFLAVADRFLRAFAKALPTVPADELAARFHFLTGSVIHFLTHHASLDGGSTMEAALGRLIRFSAAGFREGTEVAAPAEKGPQATFNF